MHIYYVYLLLRTAAMACCSFADNIRPRFAEALSRAMARSSATTPLARQPVVRRTEEPRAS